MCESNTADAIRCSGFPYSDVRHGCFKVPGVSSIGDILGMGVYLTTAVKCGKTGYGIASLTIDQCPHLLKRLWGSSPG